MIKQIAAATTFTNPVANNDVLSLVNGILNWMIYIAIPIAVLVIIFAGVILLTSGGVKTKIDLGKKMLTWAIVGLAIILIGKGFITLIVSVINLAK